MHRFKNAPSVGSDVLSSPLAQSVDLCTSGYNKHSACLSNSCIPVHIDVYRITRNTCEPAAELIIGLRGGVPLLKWAVLIPVKASGIFHREVISPRIISAKVCWFEASWIVNAILTFQIMRTSRDNKQKYRSHKLNSHANIDQGDHNLALPRLLVHVRVLQQGYTQSSVCSPSVKCMYVIHLEHPT